MTKCLRASILTLIFLTQILLSQVVLYDGGYDKDINAAFNSHPTANKITRENFIDFYRVGRRSSQRVKNNDLSIADFILSTEYKKNGDMITRKFSIKEFDSSSLPIFEDSLNYSKLDKPEVIREKIKKIIHKTLNSCNIPKSDFSENEYATVFINFFEGKGTLGIYDNEKMVAVVKPNEAMYYFAQPGTHEIKFVLKKGKTKYDFKNHETYSFKKGSAYTINFKGDKDLQTRYPLVPTKKVNYGSELRQSLVKTLVANNDALKQKRDEKEQQRRVRVEKSLETPRSIPSAGSQPPYTPINPSAFPEEIRELYQTAIGFYGKDIINYSVSLFNQPNALAEYKKYRNYLYIARKTERIPSLAKKIFGAELPVTGSAKVFDPIFYGTASAMAPSDAQGLAHGYGSIKNSNCYFAGTFEHGHIKFGILWTKDEQYIGSFKFGQKHGKGASKKADSHGAYVGGFRDGKREGFGLTIGDYNSGSVIGYFGNGFIHGANVSLSMKSISSWSATYKIKNNGSKGYTKIRVTSGGYISIDYNDENGKRQGLGLEVEIYQNYAAYYYLGTYVNNVREGRWYKYMHLYETSPNPPTKPFEYSTYRNHIEVAGTTVKLQSFSDFNIGKAILGTVAFLGITNSNFSSAQKMQLGLSAAQDIMNDDHSFSSTQGTLDDIKEMQQSTLDAYRQSAANVAAMEQRSSSNTTGQPKPHSMVLSDEYRVDGNKNEWVKSRPNQAPASYQVVPQQQQKGNQINASTSQSPTAAKVTSKLDDRNPKSAFAMISGEGGPSTKRDTIIDTRPIFGGDHWLKIVRYDTRGDGVKPNTKVYIKSSHNPGSRVKISDMGVQLMNCTLSSGSDAFDVMSDYRSCFIVRAIDGTRPYSFRFNVDCIYAN